MHHLPQTLIALMVTLPAFAFATSDSSSQTTLTDPFYYISRLVPKPVQEPVCCLRPLNPQEPVPELLTFEEWKEKQKQQKQHLPEPDPLLSSQKHLNPTEEGPDTQTTEGHHPMITQQAPLVFNQFPLTDRFNYASEDCSARIHKTHKSAQSSSAVLSRKKDKYMLSPCSTENKFMIIELCDDIRIDTVQLANFEFFSGVFRSIKISVAQTYTSDTEGWVEMGTYEAKNIRSIQSFHPLMELRPFYRYIRIDFLSHYGSEYYCPVSLVRVYGLTQMEEWKSEAWQADWQRTAAEAIIRTLQSTKSTQVTEIASSAVNSNESNIKDADFVPPSTANQTTLPPSQSDSPSISHSEESKITHSLPNADNKDVPESGNVSEPVASFYLGNNAVDSKLTLELNTTSSYNETANGSPGRVSQDSATVALTPTANVSERPLPSVTISSNAPSAARESPHVLSSNSPRLIAAHAATNFPSGESVFRAIANRITALESNATLYMQYVEVQNRSIKEAIRKLEEDVGRLVGITKTQTAAYQKAVGELAKQRREMENERSELIAQVNYLAKEVLMEKRLGFVQLGLLLFVLVFTLISRYPQGDSIFRKTSSSIRRFGGRSRMISLSSDWGDWRSPSSTPAPTTPPRETVRSIAPEVVDDNNAYSQRHQSPDPVLPLLPSSHPFPKKQGSRTSSSASESKARLSAMDPPFAFNADPRAPRRFHRSSSQNAASLSISSSSHFIPRRLAKTAHLHELKTARSDQIDSSRSRQLSFENAIGHPRRPSSRNRIRQRRISKLTPRIISQHLPPENPSLHSNNGPENGPESDAWVDTDDPGVEDRTRAVELTKQAT